MRHPNYNISNKATTNNSYISPQHIDGSPPDEDGDPDQTPLTLEKIEAKANEVFFFTFINTIEFGIFMHIFQAEILENF